MYEGAEVLPFLVSANDKLRDIVEGERATTETVDETPDFSDLAIEDAEVPADSAATDSSDVLSTNNPLFAVFRPMVSETGMAMQ